MNIIAVIAQSVSSVIAHVTAVVSTTIWLWRWKLDNEVCIDTWKLKLNTQQHLPTSLGPIKSIFALNISTQEEPSNNRLLNWAYLYHFCERLVVKRCPVLWVKRHKNGPKWSFCDEVIRERFTRCKLPYRFYGFRQCLLFFFLQLVAWNFNQTL